MTVTSDTPTSDRTTDQQYWLTIDRIVTELAGQAELDKLVELSASHAEWPVRAACVRILGDRFAENAAAQHAIAAATHDTVDSVAFAAITVAGEHRVSVAARDLIGISGWPSNFTKPAYLRKPVGCGAALTKRALIAIFGSEDPDELRRLEDAHFADIIARSAAAKARPAHRADAVLIPAGPFIAGATGTVAGPFQMNDKDNPLRVADLPAYYIDRVAVTNERYDRFVAETAGTTEFDHPDQPERESHASVHRHDPRFNRPELPATGMDWYDAWAFANWAGGTLPSEDEWEKAARGPDGRLFPWGNDWDPARVNYVERSFGTSVHDLRSLEAVLVTVGQHCPAVPVLPADSLAEGASPYGLLHMSGNVWEMTRTNYFTRKDLDPFFKGRRPVEFMNRRDAFYSLRGGTWTSPPICLSAYYRGKDLLTDKHNEIGFRCVYPAAGE
jgi:iron(II)-dependent oxidoreductase